MRITYTRDEDLDYEGVSVLDIESGQSLHFQLPLEFDERDAALGLDNYCVVVDPGQRTCYGGISGWTVAPGLLTMNFDAAAASALDLPQQLRVGLDPTELEAVVGHLTRILAPRESNRGPGS